MHTIIAFILNMVERGTEDGPPFFKNSYYQFPEITIPMEIKTIYPKVRESIVWNVVDIL